MKKSNISRKVEESIKRQRQREIIELKETRNIKKRIWEVITKDDYHTSWYIRKKKKKKQNLYLNSALIFRVSFTFPIYYKSSYDACIQEFQYHYEREDS